MKLFYNSIATIFITLMGYFLFQGGWWQSLLCFFAAICFFAFKDPGIELKRQVKTNFDMPNAIVVGLNISGTVTRDNMTDALKALKKTGGIDY